MFFVLLNFLIALYILTYLLLHWHFKFSRPSVHNTMNLPFFVPCSIWQLYWLLLICKWCWQSLIFCMYLAKDQTISHALDLTREPHCWPGCNTWQRWVKGKEWKGTILFTVFFALSKWIVIPKFTGLIEWNYGGPLAKFPQNLRSILNCYEVILRDFMNHYSQSRISFFKNDNFLKRNPESDST